MNGVTAKRGFLILAALLILVPKVHAAQSVVTDAQGYACMGDDKSRKDTELVAMKDAKRKAAESAATYIRSETHVKDFVLEKDIIGAYSNAEVRIIQELEQGWYKEPVLGDCYRIKVKAEVVPDQQAMTKLSKVKQELLENDPSAPLMVKVWTDRKEYRQGEKVRIYLRGNKPFYGRVVYKDAGGNIVQLLPNPFRAGNYFNGGAVYEIPSGEDGYDMEVTPPFGSEGITVYASTLPHGELELETAGKVFGIKTKPADIPVKTRGIKLSSKGDAGKNNPSAAEFSEAGTDLKTGQ